MSRRSRRRHHQQYKKHHPAPRPRAFAVELTTNQPGREFQLIVKTVPPLPTGNVQGQVTVKTSSTNLPVISVTAWANVQQTVPVIQVPHPAPPMTPPGVPARPPSPGR